MSCLPARARLEELELRVSERRAAHPGEPDDEARDAVAAMVGHDSWETLRHEVARRTVLNSCDVERARALIDQDAAWATSDMSGWCDHPCGAWPLNYVAMLRLDAPRLGLTNDLSQSGAMAQLLIDAGAPIDGKPGDSETPLMTAASYGDPDVARVLIEAGADLDAVAADNAGGVPGASALMHAAVFGMTGVLDLLVEAGAKMRSLVEAAAAGNIGGRLTGDESPDDKLRALIMAADHQRLDVIDELLAAGTPIDVIDPRWRRHALRLAAQNGRADSVRHLLARGADPALEDDRGRTALDLCDGHDEVAAILAPLTP
ncbi:MAG: ankyrin repeat domain-containing protein [Solirubrobacterales bacterium]|nr:ankyrin repeat domain-containing protein [Solirubrobacterales bacterium]